MLLFYLSNISSFKSLLYFCYYDFSDIMCWALNSEPPHPQQMEQHKKNGVSVCVSAFKFERLVDDFFAEVLYDNI